MVFYGFLDPQFSKCEGIEAIEFVNDFDDRICKIYPIVSASLQSMNWILRNCYKKYTDYLY